MKICSFLAVLMLLSINTFSNERCYYSLQSKSLKINQHFDNPKDKKFSVGLSIAGTYFDTQRGRRYLSTHNFHKMKVHKKNLEKKFSIAKKNKFSVPLANAAIYPDFKLKVQLVDIDDYMTLILGVYSADGKNPILAEDEISVDFSKYFKYGAPGSTTLNFSFGIFGELSAKLVKRCM